MSVQLLDLLDTLDPQDASPEALFGQEGINVSRRSRSLKESAAYVEKLARTIEFLAEIKRGRRPMRHLSEAMTTSDFPLLFGDVLDKLVLANYRETPVSYPGYMATTTVRDFRLVSRFTIDGLEDRYDEVLERGEYKQAALTEARTQYKVKKYGRGASFSWEAMINDDVSMFDQIPARLGRGARRTEEHFATSLFVDANGPHDSVYTVGNANIITGNPALSITSLQSALNQLYSMRDSEGEPIVIQMAHLVVPPSLAIVAQNIMNALQVVIQGTGSGLGSGANMELVVNNWMRGALTLHVNHYIPVVSSASLGSTCWFLFADPGDWRPAAEIAHLRGHEEPEIFMKRPDSVRVGGGEVNPQEEGDFDHDTHQYKSRLVLGGSIIEPKATLASEGDGS